MKIILVALVLCAAVVLCEGLSGAPVSFYVGLTAHMVDATGSVLKYQHLLVNQGLAYAPNSGYFTAPYDGIYVFNIVVSAAPKRQAAVSLFHNLNGKEVCVATVWAVSYPHWATSSHTIYLQLTAGQQVYQKSRAGLRLYYYGNMYTSFSGHMLSGRD